MYIWILKRHLKNIRLNRKIKKLRREVPLGYEQVAKRIRKDKRSLRFV
jgi:hypothetical protein